MLKYILCSLNIAHFNNLQYNHHHFKQQELYVLSNEYWYILRTRMQISVNVNVNLHLSFKFQAHVTLLSIKMMY